jgi:bleomycin hydrolase
MKKTLLVAALTTISISATAQSITPKMLEKFQTENALTTTDRAIHNAMAANDVSKLAVNQANQSEMDTYFSHSVPSRGITDQQSSGRCWLFTGLNVMRSKVINKHNLPELTFSHVYNFFYDQLEK